MPNSSGGSRRPVPVRGRIYRSLYASSGFCSRQTLAGSCEISMPTLSQYLSELMEEGLVRYSGAGQSTGGRRARGLDIVPDARIAVGVSVTENYLRLVATDLRLRELAYQKLPFRMFSGRRGEDGAPLAEVLETFLDAHGLDRGRLLGVGITLPGMISPDGDRIFMAPPLNLYDTPLDGLTRGIPYPVHAENDGSCSGYAEWFVRGGQGNMAYLSLESGVGGAVLIGGVPYDGDHRRSGEFGHICVEPGGLRCSCGKRGCLEAYCSVRRISDELNVTTQEFFRGIELHIPEYETLWFDVLRHLAIGINNIHMALDCAVVLGGVLTEYLQPWLPALKKYVSAGNPFEPDADFVQLSILRKHIAPLGAALYFVREFVEQI